MDQKRSVRNTGKALGRAAFVAKNPSPVWCHSNVIAIAAVIGLVLNVPLQAEERQPVKESSKSLSTAHDELVERGRYLATIGACEACHTSPDVAPQNPDPHNAGQLAKERRFRSDPDWVRYMNPDGQNRMAGGLPFILRFSRESSGVVVSSNLTPDAETGLGQWSMGEIVEVIRSGKRKDGTALFLFPPHSLFNALAEEDANAIAAYLKSLPPKRNAIPNRSVPFATQPARRVSERKAAPKGRTLARAKYLMDALVGCKECHSHKKNGELIEFAGGDPVDPFQGTFRLGPDLPLRPDEKGFAAFPYPGYAVLYGSNITRFGGRGDLSFVSTDQIVRAIRQGISVQPDRYGRPRPLAHAMLWQFYASMSDEDAYAIADYLKTLRFIPHFVEPELSLYGEDWEAAFEKVFGETPSDNDRVIFGR